MTLNQRAEAIAYKLGDQFNFTLRESIKDTLIYYRAKYIKDDLDKNFLSHIDYLQTFTMKLKEVDILEEFDASLCKVASNCLSSLDRERFKMLRTVDKIPKPVRIKSWGKMSYKFVGTVDHIIPFEFTTLEEYQYKKELPFQDKQIAYTFINGYIYIINNLELCDLLLDGIFANPRDIYSLCSEEGFTDDNDFPIAMDMMLSMEKSIVSGEYPLVNKDGQQINLQADARDKNNV
jgi:hypothetical protein